MELDGADEDTLDVDQLLWDDSVMGDARLDRWLEDAAAFEALRSDLRRRHGTGQALVHDRQLVGVFASWDDAFAAGLRQFGTGANFLIRRIEEDDIAEAPALVLGLMDAKVP